MHRKGAEDAKRAKLFTKIIRELTVAAKIGGPDPESNPCLRAALISAESANIPKDKIERAIKRGEGSEESAEYQGSRFLPRSSLQHCLVWRGCLAATYYRNVYF